MTTNSIDNSVENVPVSGDSVEVTPTEEKREYYDIYAGVEVIRKTSRGFRGNYLSRNYDSKIDSVYALE